MYENGGGCVALGCDGVPKYKRRKVSAKRDFPPGCWSVLSPFNIRNINNLTDVLDKHRSTNGLMDDANLDSHGIVVGELPKSKNFESTRYSNGVANNSSVSNVCLPSLLNFHSQTEKPEKLVESNILAKNLHRRFPPRRRVSAVRHFPMHFNRGKPLQTNVGCIKAQASSESSSLRNHVVENNVLNSNQSVGRSSLESNEVTKSKINARTKHEHLPITNSGEKLKNEFQSGDVEEPHECRLPKCHFTSPVVMSETGSELVDSDVKSDDSDSDSGIEIVFCDEIGKDAEIIIPPQASLSSRQNRHASNFSVDRGCVLANEGRNLGSESSHSTEGSHSSESSHASGNASVFTEVVDLEDESARSELSHKNEDNNMIIRAPILALSCPLIKNKVDGISPNDIQEDEELELVSSGGKKKSKAKKLLDKRRVLSSLSKRRNACTKYTRTTPLKVRYPYITVVEVEGGERCDDVYSSCRTNDADLAHIVSNYAETQNDSEDCILYSKVRETRHQNQTVFRKLMNKEEAKTVRRAIDVRRRDDQVSGKILEGQEDQNVTPIPMLQEFVSTEIKKPKKSRGRHVCRQDISEGTEQIPIRAINTIDDQQPPAFKYVTSMVYPDWCRPLPLRGCNCVGGCSDSPKCACAVRNGGEIPFNSHGCIVEIKEFGLVYECGPSCKCPPSCPNRVSQFGIRFPLEIFKTESRGWGVRCRKKIPSGSFICEYLGELLEDKQAEQRINSDEYLFDIESSFSNPEMEIVDDVAFTIDAKRYGNVGRFINHSCSPNLYAQRILYDHEHGKVAHIMFFAADDIPHLQELTYHYNYKIGEVTDVNGNVKIKQCFCGSEECTGRMY